MGDFVGNVLLSILAIFLPPVVALIKVELNEKFEEKQMFFFSRLDVRHIFGLMCS